MSGTAAELGTILGVWAHPDDETYLSGGLMAHGVRAGAVVACVTATRGEAGSSDEVRWPPGAPLAATRTSELERALACLGVADHTWLDYPDGGCVSIEDAVAVESICAVIDRVRPDTVLSFGPDGVTGHDDHRAVSRWATRATARAGHAGTRLLFATYTPQWLEQFRQPFEAVGAFMGAEPPSTDADDCAVHTVLTEDLLDVKLSAILCQTSQIDPLVAGLGMSLLRRSLAEEAFRPAG